jgi:ATP-dependent helicase HepA
VQHASVGQEVLLRGEPPRLGVVTKVYETEQGTYYIVFTDGQLALHVAAEDATPVPQSREPAVVDRDEFLRGLLLHKLSHPFSDVLYSYRGTRTSFEVYQFKPVFKYFGSDRRSLLIADEVGLGKTIEASLIYLELKARTEMPRVLVACPSGLREKWRSELKLRFDEDFQILDAKGLDQFIDLYQKTAGLHRLRGIASLELLRRNDIQEKLVHGSVELDLLIVDEAHHLRNAWTETHRVGRLLADRADNLLLLTATPLQTGTDNLFNLLQILEPGTFEDFSTFDSLLVPNSYVNIAIRALGGRPPEVVAAIEQLKALDKFSWLRDNAVRRRALVQLEGNGRPHADDLVRIRRDLLELNSLSFVFTRTKKKDVANTALREAQTVRVQLSAAERAFYDAMLEYVRREIAARGGPLPAFAMVTRERQAASCIVATRKYLEETLKTRSSQIQYEDTNLGLDEDPDERPGTRELRELEELLELSRSVGDIDAKRDALLQLLREIQAAAADQKILVFSFFRRTLAYLKNELATAGFQVSLINGDVPPQQRQRLMEQFRDAETPAVLLSSEVGAEGLDFQFCDTLINYDLPWNPMKVEQRIGRIDRYGQKSPKIKIFNLLIDDTIETRILERLYTRIRIFEEAIGDLEPIIGPEVQQLTVEAMSKKLTPEQEEQLVYETALRVANRRQLDEEFEQQRAQLMAQDSLFLSEVNDAVREGRVVSSTEVSAILREWLKLEFPASRLEPAGDGSWHLSPEPALAVRYQGYIASLPDKSERDVQLLQRLSGKNGVPCTFDADLASRRSSLEFFHVRHALVRAAVDYFRKLDEQARRRTDWRVARLHVRTDDVPGGLYSFFLYALHVDAVNAQLTFVPIVVDQQGESVPEVAQRLLALIQEGSEPSDREINWDRQSELGEAQRSLIAGERIRMQALAKERNDALIEVRLASVRRSFDAKIKKREEWLVEARDERIRRMRLAEIANLQHQRDEKLAEIESKRHALVTYELVAEGVLEVVPPTPIQAATEWAALSGDPTAPTTTARPPAGNEARPDEATGPLDTEPTGPAGPPAPAGESQAPAPAEPPLADQANRPGLLGRLIQRLRNN